VSGALVVQPANHQWDHSYVSSVLAAHPTKFVGCLLADPTPGTCSPGCACVRARACGAGGVQGPDRRTSVPGDKPPVN
jgi:hypothetical protein